jgi:hypothetical protein
MAHFRGTIKGSRGLASRLGTTNSGLIVTANGWDAGVRVEGQSGSPGDVFYVYATGGSHNGASPRLIAVVRETPDGFAVENDYKV